MKTAQLTLCAASLVAATIFTSGCGKKEVPNANVDVTGGLYREAPQSSQVIEEVKNTAAKNDDLPKGDSSYPLEQYQVINGNHIVYWTSLALSGESPDWENIAKVTSMKKMFGLDGFKKRDMVQSLIPNYEKEIAKAKDGNKYWKVSFYFGDPGDVGIYDLKSKSFAIRALDKLQITPNNPAEWVPSSPQYVYDRTDAFIELSADENKFKALSVLNEADARVIEEKIQQHAREGDLSMNVYGYVQSGTGGGSLGKPIGVKLQVLAVELYAKTRNESLLIIK